MKNLNPIYITEDKTVDFDISGMKQRIKEIPQIYKKKFNSFKNGPTFWDLEKINKWKDGAKLEVGRDLKKALNKKKVANGLKKGALKLLKK